MSMGQGWCAKLVDKEKRRVVGLQHGTYKGVLSKRATPIEGDMSEPAPEPFVWKERTGKNAVLAPVKVGFRYRQWKRKPKVLVAPKMKVA